MSTTRIVSSVTAIPGATLMKKIQRQPIVSVMIPPTVGPSVGASTETMPRIAGINARCLPSKIVKPTANTLGTIAPPTKPWMTRKAIIDSMFQARPQATLDSVNSAAEVANSQRVDIACARKAEKGIITSSAIR
jgi:hypothetical protein